MRQSVALHENLRRRVAIQDLLLTEGEARAVACVNTTPFAFYRSATTQRA